MVATTTVELRNLLKTDFELFDFDYEFDDQEFKSELEQAVIDFYFNYEIGQETPDDFKRVFKRRWLSMIGYYNKLYNTTLLEYNPLINYSVTEALEQLSQSNQTQKNTINTDNDTTSQTKSNNTEDIDETMSDYPQQPIAGGDYASGARIATNTSASTMDVTDNSTSTSDENRTTDETNNTEYEKTIEGLTGITYQDLIQKERDNLIRITGMVIEEMKPCFILVH